MARSIRSIATAAQCVALALALASDAAGQQGAPAQAPPDTGQASAAASQIAPAPAAPRPPIPNRVNELLPSWLRLRAELRERMEGFDGLGFDATRQDLYWLTRVRVNTTIAPSRHLSFQVQVQDARVGGKRVGPTGTPFRAPFDLRTAFVDAGAGTAPVTVRLGRQELAFGEQRLVGHVSWLNAARTFDAVKVTIRTRAVQADVFGASVVRILDGFDRSGNGNRFAGAYVTAPRLVPRGSIEPYVFFRRDTDLLGETGVVGDLEQTTIGVRAAGMLPAGFEYGVEMALQRGSLGPDDIEAWAGHWQLRKALGAKGAPRVTGEYNFASGDADPTDGIRGTFDQLYPTPHDKYGLADQIGWKNVHHARAGVELTPVRGWPISGNYHSWWLAERRDAIYTVASAPLARGAGGALSRHVGQELDVQVSRTITPQLQLGAGYAHIFSGAFLKEATPGSSYSHPYVMLTYVLLADK